MNTVRVFANIIIFTITLMVSHAYCDIKQYHNMLEILSEKPKQKYEHYSKIIKSYDANGQIAAVDILEYDYINQCLKYDIYLRAVDSKQLIGDSALGSLMPAHSEIYRQNEFFLLDNDGIAWIKKDYDVSKMLSQLAPFLESPKLIDNTLYIGYSKAYAAQLKIATETGNAGMAIDVLRKKRALDLALHPDGILMIEDGSFKYKFVVDSDGFISNYEETYKGQLKQKCENYFSGRNLDSVLMQIKKGVVQSAPISLKDQYHEVYDSKSYVFGLGLNRVDEKVFAAKMLSNSSAKIGGIQVGDEILTINDKDLSNISNDEIMSIMSKNNSVKLAFKNKEGIIKSITITKVPLQTAE